MTTSALHFTDEEKAEFVHHALIALLWSTTHGEDGNLDDEHGVEDIHPNTLAGFKANCEDFLEKTPRISSTPKTPSTTRWSRLGMTSVSLAMATAPVSLIGA